KHTVNIYIFYIKHVINYFVLNHKLISFEYLEHDAYFNNCRFKLIYYIAINIVYNPTILSYLNCSIIFDV
ncbi:hypothetical protein IW150_006578, partial [Coemansia sp. RSA 2607]